MRRSFIALGCIALIAGFFVWRARVAVPNSRLLDAEALSHGNAPPTSSAPTRGSSQELPIRIQAELPAGGTNVQRGAVVPLEDRVSGRVEDPEFAAKYVGWSAAKLQERLNDVEQSFLLEVERRCELRFEAGQYRVVDGSELEGLDGSYDVLSQLDAQGVMSRSRAVAHDLSGQEPAGEDPLGARIEYQVVSLLPEAYPELYRQRAELEWLRATLATQDAPSEDPR